MPHWLVYQFMMPAMYFHLVSVLGSRYEQFGLNGEQYAPYEIPISLFILVLLVVVSRWTADPARPLAFTMKLYLLQCALVMIMIAQYCMLQGAASQTFILVYVLLNKMQDLLFFIFEAMEFAFYGRVARLAPALMATLMTVQTCAFNFAEFFHCWLAPTLVDRYSSCSIGTSGILCCERDAYPLVAGVLTGISLMFLTTQWNRIDTYQNVQDIGWTVQPGRVGDRLFVAALFVGLIAFTVSQVFEFDI